MIKWNIDSVFQMMPTNCCGIEAEDCAKLSGIWSGALEENFKEYLFSFLGQIVLLPWSEKWK